MTSLRIADICTLEKGQYATMKTPPGEYPLVVTAGFRRSADSFQMEGPAVCVPLVSSTGHGDATMHRVHYQEGPFALANLLVALKPRGSTCSAKYLYYLLMAKKDELFVPLMQGTANVSLKVDDIANVHISVPNLINQRRVVSDIDALVAKLGELREAQTEIAMEAKAMLHSAFAKIIKDAPIRKMDDIAPLVRRPVEVRMGEEYPELGIRSFGKGTFHKPALDYMSVGTKRLYSIVPGDLLFSNVFAWEGAIAVARLEDEGRFGSHRFITCVPREGVATAEFLCFYFLTNEGLKKIGEASPGGAGRNRTLGLAKLAEIEVPVPAFEKQVWFNRLQAKVSAMLAAQQDAETELNAMLPSILDKAFKGEL